ncbi:unnamed protein product [Sympodiomycopsis kandeliae]
MLLKTAFSSLLAATLSATVASAGFFDSPLEQLQARQQGDALNASSTASTSSSSSASPSSTSSSQDASSTAGFVNNGTIGTYPCALPATAGDNAQLVYSPNQVPGKECADALPPVYPYNAIRIRSEDDSIRATFLPYGASLAELWVKDRQGQWSDVVLGFDNTTNYGTDTAHNFFGPIVGRYANRVRNGTFSLDGKKYQIPKNENNLDSLHGGTVGYDRESWKLADVNDTSVTFKHVDPAGNQGFPNEVNTTAVYTLLPNAEWKINFHSKASGPTPIMLSSHDYWNLNPQGLVNLTSDDKAILEHVVHMPYASKHVKTDGILIPTGELPDSKGTPYDFTTPRALSERFNQTQDICGTGCQGWDSCFIEPKGHPAGKVGFSIYSPASGIKLEIKSNQEAWQMYTTAGLAGPAKGHIPRKRAHGGDGTLDKIYENYSAVVIEAEDWIDGINHPKWGRQDKQIFDKNKDYHFTATYSFSTVDENGKSS